MDIIELEKRLKVTDLNQYKMNDMEKFIMGALKYRKWRTAKALEKIKDLWDGIYAKPTAAFYFDGVIRYLKDGGGTLSYGNKNFIDKHKNIEAIEPSEDEVRCKRDRGRVAKKQVKEITSAIKAVQSAVEHFSYGIRFNGCCMMTFESEKEQEMFLKGLEMASVIKDYKKIHVKSDAITEVE